ncbi:MAG: hypothetical protein NTZ42_03020 [Candidatus Gribaldobacteria bacterium]|nr:hypothetical protein [Candidatus Gribaldobacteria bacterium]
MGSAINGFVDLQNNGGWNVNFSSPDLSVAQVKLAVRKLWSKGVVMFCPTIITSDPIIVAENLRIISMARKENPLVEFSIPAIHIEGFLISSEPGYCGAHNPDWIWNKAYPRIFDEWQETAEGLIKIFTLAPEKNGAIEFISELVEKGIVVALGHTNASEEQIDDAIRAGATGATHLGNGCPKQMDRSENIIQWLLAREELWTSFVPDGYHINFSALKNYISAKKDTGCIAVSDAIYMTGTLPGKGKLNGLDIEMLENGKICLSGTENLAGSSLTMDQAYLNLANIVGWQDALMMASFLPAAIIGVNKKLHECKVKLDKFGEVMETYIQGEKVFEKK